MSAREDTAPGTVLKWLRDTDNRGAIATVLAIVTALVTGIWGIYKYTHKSSGGPPATTITQTAGEGSQQIAVGDGGQVIVESRVTAEELAKELAPLLAGLPSRQEVSQELRELRDEMESTTQQVEKEYDLALESLKQGEFRVAISLLKRALERVETPGLHIALSNTYFWVKEHELGIEHGTNALRGYQEAGKTEKVAAVKNDLALHYSKAGEPEEAEKLYKGALESFRRMAEDDPVKYEPDVALVLRNLGNDLSASRRSPSVATAALVESLEILRRLATATEDVHDLDLAKTLDALGILYMRTGQPLEAEAAYKEAQGIFRRVADEDPFKEVFLALSFNNLAENYRIYDRLDESEASFKDALSIYGRLAEENPQRHGGMYSHISNNLALIYRESRRFDEAEEAYRDSLNMVRRLAKVDAQLFEPTVALVVTNLANLLEFAGKYDEAERGYEEAVVLYRRLAEEEPSIYGGKLGKTLTIAASFYTTHKPNRAKAEAYIEEARPLLNDKDLQLQLEIISIIAETIEEHDNPWSVDSSNNATHGPTGLSFPPSFSGLTRSLVGPSHIPAKPGAVSANYASESDPTIFIALIPDTADPPTEAEAFVEAITRITLSRIANGEREGSSTIAMTCRTSPTTFALSGLVTPSGPQSFIAAIIEKHMISIHVLGVASPPEAKLWLLDLIRDFGWPCATA